MTDTIHANGIDIAYRLDGPQAAPLVTLSNSLASTMAMWDAQVPALTPDWRVLRYDTRGHGGTSAPPAPYRMETLAADLIGLWDALGVARSAFVGLSLGGMIGQAIGIDHAHRVSALVLCDTLARWPQGAGTIWDGRIRVVQTQGVKALVDGTIERWFTADFRASGSPEIARIGAMIGATPAPGYAGCSYAIKGIDFLDRLKAISVPTLVMVGADDPATPPSAAREIQQKIPGAKLVVIENAAHLANVEQPKAFNRALRNFLDAL